MRTSNCAIVHTGIVGLVLALLVAMAPGPAAAQNKNRARFQSGPLPVEIENVGPFWEGHDIASLVAHLAKVGDRGEFETTEAFTSRQERLFSTYAYGKVRITDRIAVSSLLFRRDTIDFWPHYRYDPDNEVFQLCVGERQYEYRRDEKVRGSYIGSNAFGVKKKITQRRILSIRITFAGTSMPDPCFVPVSMSRANAKRNTELAGWALIGQLERPYLSVQSDSTSPTITYPFQDETTEFLLVLKVEEAIAFDVKSGRVFYRRGWDEPTSPFEKAMGQCPVEPHPDAENCAKKVADCNNWYGSDMIAFRRCIDVPVR